MKPFETVFCEENACQQIHFTRTLWWKLLPFYAWPFVALLGGVRSSHFEAERRLLDSLATAKDMRDAHSLMNDYLRDTAAGSWLRTVTGTRISLWRVKELTRAYLPGAGSHSSFPFQAAPKIEP